MTLTRFILITILSLVLGQALASTNIGPDNWQWWAIIACYLIYGAIKP